MGQPGAYLTTKRHGCETRPAAQRVHDYGDIVLDVPLEERRAQASRCMNCGVAFCQSGLLFNDARQPTGCPLHNLVPEVNDLLFRGRMDEAVRRLALTNPFPEFTGRVCPAPCETACNLGLHDDAVTIHDNERAVSDYAWAQGVEPLPGPQPDAPLVSIVGSGPAGLAAAWELARRGPRTGPTAWAFHAWNSRAWKKTQAGTVSCFTCAGRTLWTAPPSTISSRTCRTQMRTQMRRAGFPSHQRGAS